MVRSHTGALVRDNAVLAAFLRQCGIVQVETYDTFVETIELFAMAPRDPTLGQDVIVVSGSGGGAAVAADALESAGVALAPLAAPTIERISATLPEFGSVTNPLDGTGSIYDDPAMLPALMDAILGNPGNSVIACAVSASANSPQMRRFAGIFADAAKASGRTVAAYQPSPLGASLNPDIVKTLNDGGVPLLLGISEAMAAIERLLVRQRYWTNARPAPPTARRRGRCLAGRLYRPAHGARRRRCPCCRHPLCCFRTGRDGGSARRRLPGGRKGRSAGPAAQERHRLRPARLRHR